MWRPEPAASLCLLSRDGHRCACSAKTYCTSLDMSSNPDPEYASTCQTHRRRRTGPSRALASPGSPPCGPTAAAGRPATPRCRTAARRQRALPPPTRHAAAAPARRPRRLHENSETVSTASSRFQSGARKSAWAAELTRRSSACPATASPARSGSTGQFPSTSAITSSVVLDVIACCCVHVDIAASHARDAAGICRVRAGGPPAVQRHSAGGGQQRTRPQQALGFAQQRRQQRLARPAILRLRRINYNSHGSM